MVVCHGLGDAKDGRIPAVAIAGDQNQIARLGPLQHRGQQHQGLGRARIAERVPERILDLRLDIQLQAAQGRLHGALARTGNSRAGDIPGAHPTPVQHPRDCGGDKTVVAELVLKPAREGAQVVLLFGAPGAEKLLAHGIRPDHLGQHTVGADHQRSARIAIVLLLLGIGLTHARVARTYQQALTVLHQVERGQQGRGAGPERIGEIHGPDFGLGIQHRGHGDCRLFLSVGRGGRGKKYSGQALGILSTQGVDAGVDR